jgi:hypothetical protein
MTGHSCSITSEKVTAGLMNLHPFNQLTDGTEFRTGGGQDDKKGQNPGAGSGTRHRTANKRQRAAAAPTRGRKGRTGSATRGTSRGGTAHGGAARGARSAYGSTAPYGGAARGARSAHGSTAADGSTACSAAYGDAACLTFRTRCRPAFRTAADSGTTPSITRPDQPGGTATTVPSATRLAPAGSAGRPGAHQPAVAITEPAKHASTATR